MKTVLFGLTAFGLLGSAVGAGALDDDSASRVTTSRSVQVATVRGDTDGAPWYLIQQAFSSELSACLVTANGRNMAVRMEATDAAVAAERLLSGECDAVFISGERVPNELRGYQFHALRAVSEIGVPVRVFHFVLRSEAASSTGALSEAFVKVTASKEFQETVGRMATMRVVSGARSAQ